MFQICLKWTSRSIHYYIYVLTYVSKCSKHRPYNDIPIMSVVQNLCHVVTYRYLTLFTVNTTSQIIPGRSNTALILYVTRAAYLVVSTPACIDLALTRGMDWHNRNMRRVLRLNLFDNNIIMNVNWFLRRR